MVSVVGQFDGMVTLPRIADVYEALGRFLRDLNLLSEVGKTLQEERDLNMLKLNKQGRRNQISP